MESKIIITDLPTKHRKEQAFLSFSMKLRNGRNKKYCNVGVFQVLNPEHDYYGQWTLSSYFFDESFTKFFDTKEEAVKCAEDYLGTMKVQYESGLRNWWTGVLKE